MDQMPELLAITTERVNIVYESARTKLAEDPAMIVDGIRLVDVYQELSRWKYQCERGVLPVMGLSDLTNISLRFKLGQERNAPTLSELL